MNMHVLHAYVYMHEFACVCGCVCVCHVCVCMCRVFVYVCHVNKKIHWNKLYPITQLLVAKCIVAMHLMKCSQIATLHIKMIFYIVMSFRESCFQQLTLAFKITSLYCIKKVLIYPIIVQSGLPQNEISLLRFPYAWKCFDCRDVFVKQNH